MNPTRPTTSNKTPRLNLHDVTLCCLDTRSPELAVYALRRSMRDIDFGRVLLLSTADARRCDLTGIELVEIEPVTSIQAYSGFMLKRLNDHVHTPHVLVIQWDGFVLRPHLWRNDYLQFDYIGAPWWRRPEGRNVGNGGFSLRSKKLLTALSSQEFVPEHPEDDFICITHRPRLESAYGIRFAPVQTAATFAYERFESDKHTFGFHGYFNFPDFMTSRELATYLAQLPRSITRSNDTKDLIKRLLDKGDHVNAYTLIRTRLVLTGIWRGNLKMYLRASIGLLLDAVRRRIGLTDQDTENSRGPSA